MSEPSEFDISISADKRRRHKGRRSATGAVETSSRLCDHPGCKRKGSYRAPKSPQQLDEFYWFCRKHVREYNHKWNFFDETGAGETAAGGEDGSGAGSAEEQRRRRQEKAWQRHGINDPFEILGAKGTKLKTAADAAMLRLTPDERRAVGILEVKASWSKTRIRQKYASLVKDYHPDLNGGYREDEERLREVLWAWDQIKNSRHFSI